MRRVIEWIIGLLALLACAGIIFAVTTAHAAETGVGAYTVAHYRTWPESMQTSYVLGAMGTLDRIGLACHNPSTVGVMMAWLNSEFTRPSENLADAIFRLSVERHGCHIRPRGVRSNT